MPICIDDLLDRQLTDEEIDQLVEKCSRGGKMNIGAMEVLTPDDMREIYKLANE
jgi:alcohol dehydrogenase YqhD (iron-dependent ADH family)